MSLVDGPTGRELARAELSDRIYADAQPSLPERVVEWLTERLNAWLALADEAPGGQWLLAAAATAFVGSAVWLTIRWHRARPARNTEIFDTTEPPSAGNFRAAANHHYQANEWNSALVAATRAVVSDLQERALVPIGPGVTIAEVSEAAADPDVRDTLVVFEEVRYGGQRCTAAQAQSAIRLARAASRASEARP